VEIILCHADMDELFHPCSQTGGMRHVERREAVFFGGAGVVDLIELVACAKFRASSVP
jgi:hypothetical protein